MCVFVYIGYLCEGKRRLVGWLVVCLLVGEGKRVVSWLKLCVKRVLHLK